MDKKIIIIIGGIAMLIVLGSLILLMKPSTTACNLSCEGNLVLDNEACDCTCNLTSCQENFTLNPIRCACECQSWLCPPGEEPEQGNCTCIAELPSNNSSDGNPELRSLFQNITLDNWNTSNLPTITYNMKPGENLTVNVTTKYSGDIIELYLVLSYNETQYNAKLRPATVTKAPYFHTSDLDWVSQYYSFGATGANLSTTKFQFEAWQNATKGSLELNFEMGGYLGVEWQHGAEQSIIINIE